MHENIIILIITLIVLVYGYYSQSLLNFNISGPMVFTSIGILLSPIGFNAINITINTEFVTITAEIALIIILFSDASGLNLKRLKSQWTIPTRLLFIGLPLTIVFSSLVAFLIFPDEASIYLILLALLLAPTDAALGKAVVLDHRVPEKIRSSINVESGLNDGIVFPILIGVVAIITAEEGSGDTHWLLFIGQQILFGAVIGSVVGYVNAYISKQTIYNNKVEVSYKNLIPIAIAILSYYTAEYFGGNGFIAAFFSGLFLGNYNEDLKENVDNFVESESELLILISFIVFGLVFIPATINFLDFNVVLYSLLSLTILRMLPVAISLIGTKLDLATILFIGWFGPRGIASVLYVLIVVGEVLSIKAHETIYAVVTLTIFLSVFLHGLSAGPLVRLYSKNHKDD
jgi:NhaP-type Na+/H+ or K+/H+ antiporter